MEKLNRTRAISVGCALLQGLYPFHRKWMKDATAGNNAYLPHRGAHSTTKRQLSFEDKPFSRRRGFLFHQSPLHTNGLLPYSPRFLFIANQKRKTPTHGVRHQIVSKSPVFPRPGFNNRRWAGTANWIQPGWASVLLFARVNPEPSHWCTEIRFWWKHANVPVLFCDPQLSPLPAGRACVLAFPSFQPVNCVTNTISSCHYTFLETDNYNPFTRVRITHR